MRALKIAIVVMTVLILGGTATLVVLIARRLSPGPTVAAQVELQEAPGSHIVGMAAAGDRLMLRLQGGGPDRVVIYDLRGLRRLGRIALAP
jgi:hypothetical protein